jgi:hypothetical protein
MSNGRLRTLGTIGLAWILGISLGACAGLPLIGGDSWKEEVQLHDGRKIIAKRWVERGGRHEIGQQPPVKEEGLSFTMPTTNKRITWKSEFSKDLGYADFKPLLLDIFQGSAYLVTSPVGCLSYNKWGRPNPPYVVFKYQSKEWQRITMRELPAKIKTPNLIISSPDNEVEKLGKSFVTAAMIQQVNGELEQPEYRTILREALPKERINQMCMEMIIYKGYWVMPNDPIARKMIDRKQK